MLSLWTVVLSSVLLADGGSPDEAAPASATVTVFAGSLDEKGARDGRGEEARFNEPWGLGFDGEGNLYVADHWNEVVRRIRRDGTVETYARTLGEDGYEGGLGAAPRFVPARPSHLTVDAAGNVYLSMYSLATIQKIDRRRRVTTLVGKVRESRPVDGNREVARFVQPLGITADPGGDVWVVDACMVRRVRVSGAVRTVVGSPSCIYTYGPHEDRVEGRGRAARLKFPYAIVADGLGDVYLTDLEAILKASPKGDVRVHARGGRIVLDSLAVDASGELYAVAEAEIWKVGKDGSVSTIAHIPESSDRRPFGGSSHGLAFDRRSGDLFLASGHAVLRIHLPR